MPEDGAPGPGGSGNGAMPYPPADVRRGSRLWPAIIIIGMALVILVNGIFIYIAVKGADSVVPSYNTEKR